MEAIKRASFASNQLPAGSAPLASFEDLPSDELESPEDSEFLKKNVKDTSQDSQCSKKDVNLCNRQQSADTPDSLTISAHSTPQIEIESDFDSHFTLTPGDSCKGQSVTEFRTGSLSSLSKEETVIIKQKKGSVASLGACETVETEYDQRKSSWTDIFRSHNQSTKSGSSLTLEQENLAKGKASKKKIKSETLKKDHFEVKTKEKGKFLSIFKVGKKSNKNINSPTSPVGYGMPIDSKKNVSEYLEDIPNDGLLFKSLSLDIAPKGKENEQPKQIDLLPNFTQIQNDLDKSSSERTDSNSKFDDHKCNDKTKTGLNIADKEYNILLGQGDENICDKAINKDLSNLNVTEEDHESSESELGFEVKDPLAEKKDEDDFEAENLLAQDSSEVEEDSTLEPHPLLIQPPQQVVITSRQQRLEVTTIPIDRPRSTTPINIAPLEAFIRTISPTFDSKVEKIKLSLPGDQFVGRLKSPKKSSTKSWTDFCEEGLHSPRMQKRTDVDDFDMDSKEFSSIDNQCINQSNFEETSCNTFELSENQWVAFDAKWEHNRKTDSLSETPCVSETSSVSLKDNGVLQNPGIIRDSTKAKLIKCSCECHSYGCDNMYINSNVFSEACLESSTKSQKELSGDAFSEKCQCQCHKKYAHVWIPSQVTEELSSLDEFNSFGLSSKYALCSMQDNKF